MHTKIHSNQAFSAKTLAGALLILLFAVAPAYSQDENADAVDATRQPLSDPEIAQLEQLTQKISADRDIVEFLMDRLESVDGLIRTVTEARLDRTSAELFSSVVELGELLIEFDENGKNVSDYWDVATHYLTLLPDAAFAALDRLTARTVFPGGDMDTVTLVAADQTFFSSVRDLDNIYELLVDYLVIAEKMEIDTADVREKIVARIGDSAANRSVFLDVSIKTASALRASAAILPGNEEVQNKLSAANARVNLIATSMQNITDVLTQLGVDVRYYRQQIIMTTGEITTDVLDVNVIGDLVTKWSSAFGHLLVEEGPRVVFRMLLVLLIVYAFYRISRFAETVTNKALDTARVQISNLLRSMIISSVRNLLLVLGILIALSQLGISLGPLLAGLGIAGFIIGFAMQDSLSNFASGMLILIYRPFDVGDVVDAGGVHGKVRSMSLVNTTIMTFDNQTLVVPNNLIWGTVIKNVTAQRTRRVDLVFGIAYSDDIDKAEEVFRDIVDAHEKILDAPEPMIHLHELGDSSVNFIVRPWVKTEDYWDVYWDVTRSVKIRLEKEGISIPFPQRDVHIYEQKPA